jgi:Recombination endonuclease VII
MAVYNGLDHVSVGATRTQAREKLNKLLFEASQRGKLCFNCNTGLKRFFDKPERLRAAADYLERFHVKSD